MKESTLISGPHTLTVKPKMITLRTHQEMQDWAKKIAQRASAAGQTKSIEVVLKLMKAIPELADLITATGDFNMSTVKSMASNYKDMDQAAAEEAAKAEIQQKILSIAADSPDVARALFFPDVEISYDTESIALCIECLKATFDVNGHTKAELKLLTGPTDSDFWQDMAWEGLVEYTEKFCKLLQRN